MTLTEVQATDGSTMYYNEFDNRYYTQAEIDSLTDLLEESVTIKDFNKVLDRIWWILHSRGYAVINEVVIDMQTANAILIVWNSINDVNKQKLRERYENHGLEVVGTTCWKVISKSRA